MLLTWQTVPKTVSVRVQASWQSSIQVGLRKRGCGLAECGCGNFDTVGDVAGERRAGPKRLLVGLKLAFALRDLSLPLSVALDI